MNLKINHTRLDRITLEKCFTVDEPAPTNNHHSCYASLEGDRGTLVVELLPRYNEWRHLISAVTIIFFSMMLLVILFEIGIIDYPSANKNDLGFFEKYWLSLFIFMVNFIPLSLLIKYFADVRYLLFQGDTVIFQSRRQGRRIYRSQDLKFHLMRLDSWTSRYHIEVELPDPTLPDDRRMIFLEATAAEITMQGVLATLLPLLRGNDGPLRLATPRQYCPLPEDKPKTIANIHDNLCNHLLVWWVNYKNNQFIFWLVHGSRKKLMQKEAARSW